MIHLFVFIFSVSIGSFLNVLIYRLPIGEEFVVKRSYCPNCKHELDFYDLVPILSYLGLKGKCRYCQSKISKMYPFVELLTGFIGVYCFERFGFSITMVLHFFVLTILLVISVIDIKTMEIPDGCNFVLIVLGLIRVFMFELNLYEHIFYAGLVALIILIINRIKLSFGDGDMKLYFSLGLYLGDKVFLVLLFSIFFGSIYGIYLLMMKKANKNTIFPFGPFISLGSFVYIFFGRYLIRWLMCL